MTYSVLTMVLNWAKSELNSDKQKNESYRKALAELAVAIKRIMVFH